MTAQKRNGHKETVRENRGRRAPGQGCIELVAGSFFLILVTMAALDFFALLIGNHYNDSLARNCARVAGGQKNVADATSATNAILTGFNTSAMLSNPRIDDLFFGYFQSRVEVTTSVEVRLPVPFVFMPQSVRLQTKSCETIINPDLMPIN